MTEELKDTSSVATEESQAPEMEHPDEATMEPSESVDSTEDEQTSPDRLYANKYKTPEELEKAYKEAQSKLTMLSQDIPKRTRVEQDNVPLKTDEVLKELPQDIADMMVKDYQEKKAREVYEQQLSLDSQVFDREASVNPDIADHKEVLLELGQLKKYQSKTFTEIYEVFQDKLSKKSTDLSNTQNEEFEKAKKAASATSSSHTKPKSKIKWTQEKINNLSSAEYKQHRAEIMDYLASQK